MSNGWIKGAWAGAEKAVFADLLELLGSIEGKDAFRGAIPVGGYDMWMLSCSEGGGANITWNDAPVSVNIDALITGIFYDRDKAMGFAETLVAELPITPAGSHVQLFRLQEFPKIGVDFIPLSDARELRVWVVRATCLIVFDGARYKIK